MADDNNKDEKRYVLFSTGHQAIPHRGRAARRPAVGVGDAHQQSPISGHLLEKEEVAGALQWMQSQGYQTGKLVVLEVGRVVPVKIELDFDGETQE